MKAINLATPENSGELLTAYAISIGALQLYPDNRIRVKSGRMSPYFFNSGLFNTGKHLNTLARAYISALQGCYTTEDVFFGPAYKGITLATAIACHTGNPLAHDRKEEKDHGEGGILIGSSLKGKKVIIVDDVMTSGGSISQAYSLIHKNGGETTHCCIAFDRQEIPDDQNTTAVQIFEDTHHINVESAASLSNLLFLLRRTYNEFPTKELGEILWAIEDYNDKYCIN